MNADQTPTAAKRTERTRRGLTALASAFALAAGSLGLWAATGSTAHAAALPAPDHIVVVVMENHAYSQVIGSSSAPYINNTLKAGGADLTQSFGLTHPSEPNYYMLFSGSNQGRTDDSCVSVGSMSAPNLASELIAAGKTWASYNEGLPSQGSTTCSSGNYAQKHNPWFGFNNVPTNTAMTMAQFPTDYTTLPKVSFVVPDLCNDMHDCSVSTGDSWIQSKLGGYASWAKTHNSMLVMTFDEDNKLSGNRIPTLFYGEHVVAGASSATTYNHYNVLRTLEDLAGLTSHAGNAATAAPIADIWNTGGTTGSVTVTTPAGQTTAVGTAASLQIQATDTAGGTLAYAASGLPAGLGINASTGLISGTPTTAGSSTVTVTATDSTGPSGSATFTWTVNPVSTGCTAAQLLGNPGFETGTAAPWTASPSVVDNSTSEAAHSGSWKAWMDGYGSAHTDTLSQTVTVPAGCKATFSYWLHVDTAESGSTAYDKLTVTVNGTTVATHSNVNAATGYTQKSIDLSAYAGQSVTVKFTAVEDSSLQTSFVIDDTAVQTG